MFVRLPTFERSDALQHWLPRQPQGRHPRNDSETPRAEIVILNLIRDLWLRRSDLSIQPTYADLSLRGVLDSLP